MRAIMSGSTGPVNTARHQVTMEDVARAAGVSRALVSLVMRDSPKVSEERRARVLAAAERLGYRLLIGTGRRQPAGERRAVDAFFEHRTDGLLLVSPRLPLSEILAIGRSTPTVAVARPLRAAHVDSVTNDDLAGAALAIRHLAELGHRRIAHIDGGPGAAAAPRRTGYIRAMQW